MDRYDVRSIEFLDFDGVDENERIRVKTSLLQNDPSVELPWIDDDIKPTASKPPSRKPVPEQNKITAPAVNPAHFEEYKPHMVVNNVFINQDHFPQPPIAAIPHMMPANVVYYPNHIAPLSPPYPQTVFIPATAEVPIIQATPMHPFPQRPVYTPSHQTYQPVMSSRNIQNGLPLSPNINIDEKLPMNSNFEPVQSSQSNAVEVNIPETQIADETAAQAVVEEPAQTSEPPVVQNGEASPVITPSPAPVNKSWASLFSAKSNGITNEVVNNNETKISSEMTSNTVMDNVPSCPIKNPKKNVFIDPDCYRMGEFLLSHEVDGRTISLQPRGLLNQSNYCYINSILQALIACPPLYNLLNGLAQIVSSNEKRKPTPVIDGMCRFVKEFNHLPANLRVNKRIEGGKVPKKDQGVIINTDIPFQPNWIYRMLNRIKTDLIEGRQEDAEEFLGCLLNGLNDEMLELMKLVKNDESAPAVPEVNNAEADNWQVMGPKNKGSFTRRTDFGKTPISDIFGGYLRSRIHRAGDNITENIQPFFTLQLNIEKVNTVREALESLVTKYQLEGLTSSKTNEEVEAWQQVILDGLPVILILHLKCFDYKLEGCTKIVKALEFPIDLKIDSKLLSSKSLTPKEKQYKLFAVVYHDGQEASKGHYITDAFHVGYSSWLRYDDASVKPVVEENVLKPQGTRVPYLLFYRRCDTIRGK